MKVFISQPMKDKTNEQIEAERRRAIDNIQEKYPDEDIEVLVVDEIVMPVED